MKLPKIEQLVTYFSHLPGVGRKSAQRMAFQVLSWTPDKVKAFADALLDAKNNVCVCSSCFNYSQTEVCELCQSDQRDNGLICVVAQPRDVMAVERTKEYKGVYHVLHGVISPTSNKSPDDIKIKELIERIASGKVHEVILATNPDTEGDTTALYIARLLRNFEVKATRLAYGIPIGSNLEFADEITLLRAIEGRREM